MNKFKKAIILAVVFLASATSIVAAAWILKGSVLGTSIGTKEKKIYLSVDGSTWGTNIVSPFQGTLNPGQDTANLISLQAKSSKLLTSMQWSYENLHWYMNGVEMTTPPSGAVGDEDIADFIEISRDGGLTWTAFNTFNSSIETWVDGNADKQYDGVIELRYRLKSNVESFDNLNGQSLTFDTGLTGIE